jgi:hypothetical protein
MTEKKLPTTSPSDTGSSMGPTPPSSQGLFDPFAATQAAEQIIIQQKKFEGELVGFYERMAKHELELQEEQKKRMNAAISLGGGINSDQPPEGTGLTKYPAITVNTVLGIVLAGATLLGLSLSEEQTTALTVLVSALFLVTPVVAGYVIRAINTRKP